MEEASRWWVALSPGLYKRGYTFIEVPAESELSTNSDVETARVAKELLIQIYRSTYLHQGPYIRLQD